MLSGLITSTGVACLGRWGSKLREKIIDKRQNTEMSSILAAWSVFDPIDEGRQRVLVQSPSPGLHNDCPLAEHLSKQ